MKNAWAWVVEHWQAILAGLGAIFVGILAWGAYERRIGKLKDAVKVERTLGKINTLEAKRVQLEKKEAATAAQEQVIEKEIVQLKHEVVEVREQVKERSPDEIAARFNQLYRR